jgi:hypothetical protein
MTRSVTIPAAFFALAAALAGCGRSQPIAASDPARGTLRAAKTDQTVLAEVGIENLPENVKLLTMGLQLKDGTVLYPETIRTLPEPLSDLAGAPRLDFAFEGQDEPVHAHPQVWMAVTFRLSKVTPSVNRSTFSVILGDADGEQGCRLGLSTSVFPRDGSPSLYACIIPPGLRRHDLAMSAPLPPRPLPPTVCFRLTEVPPRRRGVLRAKRIPVETAGDPDWRLRLAAMELQ